MKRDPAITSRIMSAIKSEGGAADRALGSTLWKMGLRYRRRSNLPGKPDFVFASAKVVVFVDGDFWHGRHLQKRIERGDFKQNAGYWIPKLRRNADRDIVVTNELEAQGWEVIRIWESDLKKDQVSAADLIQRVVLSRTAPR